MWYGRWVGVGVLLGAPFLFASIWWCAVLGLVALLHTLEHRKEKPVFFGALIAGTCKAGAAIVWFWSTYPMTWAGLEPGVGQLMMVGIYWATVALSIGVGFALVIVMFARATKLHRLWLFLFPLAVVLSELVGSLTFSIYSLGPGSVPNISFGFGYVGYTLATPGMFDGLAQWAGVYGLSFFVATVATAGYTLVHQPQFRSQTLVVAGVLGALVWAAHLQLPEYEQGETSSTVITINTTFEPDLFLYDGGYLIRAHAMREAVEAALLQSPDVILLPEDTRYIDNFPSPEEALAYINQHARTDVVVIDSARATDERGKTVLRAYIFDTKAGQVYTVDKAYLVPQGEFIPYLAHLLFRLLGEDAFVKNLEQTQSYRPGVKVSYADIPKYVPGILFCTESVSPSGVKSVTNRHDASFVAHPISHAWFNHPEVLWMNLNRMLKIQAIWNNTIIIEATNLAPAKAYYPDGSMTVGETLQEGNLWQLVRYQL